MSKKVEDLIGRKFHRLTVIEREPDIYYPNKRYKDGFAKVSMWKCLCDCEPNSYVVVRGTSLRIGHTQSCGCVQKERAADHCRKEKKKYNEYNLSGEYGVGRTFNTNKTFLFDLEDYDKIKNYCWYEGDKGYIKAKSTDNSKKEIKLHRLIMDFPDKLVDHINGEKWDNRKEKLRVANKQQNARNHKLFASNSSGVTGVSWHSRDKNWSAYITFENKMIHLGSFQNKEDAIKARQEAELKYFGEFNRDRNFLK